MYIVLVQCLVAEHGMLLQSTTAYWQVKLLNCTSRGSLSMARHTPADSCFLAGRPRMFSVTCILLTGGAGSMYRLFPPLVAAALHFELPASGAAARTQATVLLE